MTIAIVVLSVLLASSIVLNVILGCLVRDLESGASHVIRSAHELARREPNPWPPPRQPRGDSPPGRGGAA